MHEVAVQFSWEVLMCSCTNGKLVVLQNLIYFLLFLVLLHFKNVFHTGMFGAIWICIFEKLCVPLGGISAALSGPCGCSWEQKQGDILGMPVRVAKNSAEPVLCSSPACAFPWKTSLPQQKDLHTETAEFQLKTHWRDLTENPTNKQKKPESFNGNQSIPTVIRANDTPLKSYLWFSPLILFLACLWVTPGSYLFWRNY